MTDNLALRLTDGEITKLKPKKGKRYFARDTVLPGFAVLVYPSGVKVYTWQPHKKRVVLGNVVKIDGGVEAARRLALTRPNPDAAKPEAAKPEAGPHLWTFRQAADAYLKRKLSERTRKDYRRYLDVDLARLGWADRPLADFRRLAVRELHDQITDKQGPVTADKVLAFVSGVYTEAFRLAEEGTLPPNPVSAAVRYNKPERDDQPWVRPEDLPEFLAVLCDLPEFLVVPRDVSADWRDCYLLGLLTGLRAERLRSLETAWVKSDRIVVPREDMKIKTGRPDFAVPLCVRAREIVERRALGGRYLFPAPGTDTGHLSGNIPEVLKDRGWPLKAMRRTHWTLGIAAGVPENVMKLLHDRSTDGSGEFYLEREGVFTTLMEAQERIATMWSRFLDARTPEAV